MNGVRLLVLEVRRDADTTPGALRFAGAHLARKVSQLLLTLSTQGHNIMRTTSFLYIPLDNDEGRRGVARAYDEGRNLCPRFRSWSCAE
jgi:hypothetical protein